MELKYISCTINIWDCLMISSLSGVDDDHMGSLIFEYEYAIGDYITFTKKVISGMFAGTYGFCLSCDSLKEAVLALSEMYKELKGAYQINDYDSDDYVLFEFAKQGHLKISGQVGGSHNQQYLVYQFMSDQTVLNEIILYFRNACSTAKLEG